MDDLDPHWLWLTGGLLLAIAELVVPGAYLIWLAAAALLTGFVTWGYDLGLEWQIGTFAASALIAVAAGRQYLRDHPIKDADPLLNRRTQRLVGEQASVSVAIDGGSGRVHHGDSEWPASGPDLPVGTRVRIIGAKGSTLLVEPLDGDRTLPPPEKL